MSYNTINFPSSGSFNLIKIKQTDESPGNGASLKLTAFRINGKTLVDHNSIGTDDSGNGNHFQDENFAAGNTDEVWSQNLTGVLTNVSGDVRSASRGFNGDTYRTAATTAQPIDTPANDLWTFTVPQSLLGKRLVAWVNSRDVGESGSDAYLYRKNKWKLDAS